MRKEMSCEITYLLGDELCFPVQMKCWHDTNILLDRKTAWLLLVPLPRNTLPLPH